MSAKFQLHPTTSFGWKAELAIVTRKRCLHSIVNGWPEVLVSFIKAVQNCHKILAVRIQHVVGPCHNRFSQLRSLVDAKVVINTPSLQPLPELGIGIIEK